MFNDKNRYDYQLTAISKIADAFEKDLKARGMLVIPTGGGKTLTALRAINVMFDKGIINKRVLWISHLKELNAQTSKVLDDQVNSVYFREDSSLEKVHAKLGLVSPMMLNAAQKEVKAHYDDIDLIVIDEAHHAAAHSFDSIFDADVGILGLTATPIRLDGRKLPFGEVFYQVPSSELFKRGVIIRPEPSPLQTNQTYRLTSIRGDKDLEALNNPRRNREITNKIFGNKKTFTKVIVFVRTKSHARALWEMFEDETSRGNFYERIGYIFGDNENDEVGVSNKDYLAKNASFDRSVIINCGVLTEGFDDPSINTIVMAVPTKSTVLFMQCVGRAIRRNPNLGDDQKKYFVNVVDDLPNINYRYDNLWTFGEILDNLEPKFQSIEYVDREDALLQVKNIIRSRPSIGPQLNKVGFNLEQFVMTEDLEESRFMLYNCSEKQEEFVWRAVFANPSEKSNLLEYYNSLAFCVADFVTNRKNIQKKFEWIQMDAVGKFLNTDVRKFNFWGALKQAHIEIQKRGKKKAEINRIEYYSFNKRENPEEDEMKKFAENCANRESFLNGIGSVKMNSLNAWAIITPWSMIGGLAVWMVSDETKNQILNTLGFFKDVLMTEDEKRYNEITSSKSPVFRDLNGVQIPYAMILLMVRDDNSIFQKEETYIKKFK